MSIIVIDTGQIAEIKSQRPHSNVLNVGVAFL